MRICKTCLGYRETKRTKKNNIVCALCNGVIENVG